MLYGYARVLTLQSRQPLRAQVAALSAAGVGAADIFTDRLADLKSAPVALDAAIERLSPRDALVVCRLDRLPLDLDAFASLIGRIFDRGAGLRVLGDRGFQLTETGLKGPGGARLDAGAGLALVLGQLARAQNTIGRERTLVGLEVARAAGRRGGRRFALSKAQVRRAQHLLQTGQVPVKGLCEELGVKPVTLYRYLGPDGSLRAHGRAVLDA